MTQIFRSERRREKHKDQLTATCPGFTARTDYKGGHWIECAAGTKLFPSAEDRDRHYRCACCRRGRGCELREMRRSIIKE